MTIRKCKYSLAAHLNVVPHVFPDVGRAFFQTLAPEERAPRSAYVLATSEVPDAHTADGRLGWWAGCGGAGISAAERPTS